MNPDSSTARVAAYYDRLAERYDSSISSFERLLLGDGRQWAASQARGQTLEIGIGTGRNLAYYPPNLSLVGVDVSPAMLSHARARALELGRRVELREASAAHLPLPDASFDTVIGTLVLCSVPDDAAVLAEANRVLKPGGRLVLLEHVRSPAWPVRLVEQILDPLMVKLEHDHLLRDPMDHIGGLGFTVETCERTKWGVIERLIAARHVE